MSSAETVSPTPGIADQREPDTGKSAADAPPAGAAAGARADVSGRRGFARLAAGLLLLALIVPAIHWMNFQATHIVTRNALVRSHLSELGVRGAGLVAEVYVRAGDRVQAGELLAKLEDRHLLARRDAAQAAVATLTERIALNNAALDFAQRRAEVDLAQASSEHQRRQAESAAARSRAQDAAAFYQAREALAGDGAISAEVIRDAAAKADTARALAEAAAATEAGALARWEAARLALEELALRRAELRVLQAQQRQAEAVLAQVEADIDSTRVLAPAAGAVLRRLAQPGMAVETGTPIVSLWLDEDTWIEAWVPEEQLGQFAPGSAVQVSFPALVGQRFSGTVVRIGLATDFEMPAGYLPQPRETRMRPTPQVGVEIRLDSAPELIRPGLSAVVDIRRNDT